MKISSTWKSSLGHTTTVDTYVTQCLRNDLGMSLTFLVEGMVDMVISWSCHVEEIDRTIATICMRA